MVPRPAPLEERDRTAEANGERVVYSSCQQNVTTT